MQKNCIKSILLKLIQTSAYACIIMEQTVMHLSMEQKFINLKQKILRLWQLIMSRKHFKRLFCRSYEENRINIKTGLKQD